MAAEKRSQFPFIKRGHSVRTKEKKQREEEGTLSRWLRELRGGSDSKSPTIDRSNPVYHSEGKGMRSKRQAKEKRRHSFNQRPQHAQQHIR
ncbi:hypothetical protein GE061_017156 [Apolygus lucorum]|uniref:Uncharacterized protein n=1 Tax=Apolygus lucorum TaxID=248454 RepID=A0A8S9XKC2_APOLU|nr:hypothetical protein GE061_017156 [Apolygus lucorum]